MVSDTDLLLSKRTGVNNLASSWQSHVFQGPTSSAVECFDLIAWAQCRQSLKVFSAAAHGFKKQLPGILIDSSGCKLTSIPCHVVYHIHGLGTSIFVTPVLRGCNQDRQSILQVCSQNTSRHQQSNIVTQKQAANTQLFVKACQDGC